MVSCTSIFLLFFPSSAHPQVVLLFSPDKYKRTEAQNNPPAPCPIAFPPSTQLCLFFPCFKDYHLAHIHLGYTKVSKTCSQVLQLCRMHYFHAFPLHAPGHHISLKLPPFYLLGKLFSLGKGWLPTARKQKLNSTTTLFEGQAERFTLNPAHTSLGQ